MRFQTLEILMLDSNQLSSAVFFGLANLRRLRQLNLQRNCISAVPYLQERECLQHLQTVQNQHDFPDVSKRHPKHISSSLEDGFLHEHVEMTSPSVGENWDHSKEFYFPLPELRFLNLANNKIAEEEALLAVALFPMLSDLDIHSNPLTSQRKGDPPVLTSFLQERLGITIRRKKTPVLVKPPIRFSKEPKRQIHTKLPTIPKAPFLSSVLDSYPTDDKGNKEKTLGKTCLPQESKSNKPSLNSSQSSRNEHQEAHTAAGTWETLDGPPEETASASYPDRESFFVTEVTGLDEAEYRQKSDELETFEKMERNENAVYPEKFRGYEMLFYAEADPDMLEPAGIQHTARRLEQTLKHLLVYRDSKANLDQIQKPFKGIVKKIANLPPPRPRKSKAEKAEEVLLEIKERKNIIEVSLETILKEKRVYKEEYEDAMALIKDMKKKYKMVHNRSMEEAAQIESERISNN